MIWKIRHSGLAEYVLTTCPRGLVAYVHPAKHSCQIFHIMEALYSLSTPKHDILYLSSGNTGLGQNFFISWFTNPPTVIFRKEEKNKKIKKSNIIFYILSTDSNFQLLRWKKKLRFCLCIFESDTVKSDSPMQENYEIFKDLIQTVGLLY